MTVLLVVAYSLSACSRNESPAETAGSSTPAPETSPESFAALLAAALSAQKAAAEAGAEWLETGKLIDQAMHESEQGNRDTAIDLVIKAKQQGDLAVAQAERESIAWQRRVVQ